MAITDTWLKANHGRPRVKAEEKPDGAGLSVRASPAGKLVFQMRYRWQGKTARTNFSRFTEFHVAEMMLGHAIPRVYDYHDYLEEQRAAYQAWARYLSLSCSSSQSMTSLTT